jgi:hypothetical protein
LEPGDDRAAGPAADDQSSAHEGPCSGKFDACAPTTDRRWRAFHTEEEETMIDRKTYFDGVRAKIFHGMLNQAQVDSMNGILMNTISAS